MATSRQAARRIANIAKTISKNQISLQQIALTRQRLNIAERVFGKGIASDGLPIDSKRKAKNRKGAYSQRYGQRRLKEGKQINLINLVFDGTFDRSLIIGRDGKKTVLGFDTDKSRMIAEKTEEYRGKAIFQATPEEKKAIFQIVIEQIRKVIRSVK